MNIEVGIDGSKSVYKKELDTTLDNTEVDIEQENYFLDDTILINAHLSELQNSDELTKVEPKQNSKFLFFGNNGYTFKTSSGVEITIENPDDLDNIHVFENPETGEVFIVEANGAKIKSSNENVSISIYDSNIQSLETGSGNDSIILDNTKVGILKTKSGADFVSLNNSEILRKDDLNNNDLKVEEKNNSEDFDISKIPEVESNETITLENAQTMPVSEYISLILTQPVGFETEEEYQQYVIQAMTDNLESARQILQNQQDDGIISDGYNALKELTGLGVSSEDVEEAIVKQEEMINALSQAMNGEGELSFEETYKKYTKVEFSTKKIDEYIKFSNIYQATLIASSYDDEYIEKLEKNTGLSLEDLAQKYYSSQSNAMGKDKFYSDFAKKYLDDQENFSAKLSNTISIAGLGCTVLGAAACWFPCGATVGIPLMTAGRYISLGGMFINNAMDLADNITDSDGLTSDEVKDLALETGVELASFISGCKIGEFTHGLNESVINKVAQIGIKQTAASILGQVTETGVDSILSLGADYVIAQGESLITNGELLNNKNYWSIDRFLGEGKNQLIGILTGLANAKVNTEMPKIQETNEEQLDMLKKYTDIGINTKRAFQLIAKDIDLVTKLNLIEVPKEAQVNMFKYFFSNNSIADETIRNIDFTQYKETGLPLEYSRKDFISDLNQVLSNVSNTQRTQILKQLNIKLTQDGNGYDGIIDLSQLNTDGIEGKVLEMATRFTDNKIKTGNEEIDTMLNSLISGMPEFINTIGKQQHETHGYTLDIHILEAYKNALSDVNYANLSDYQKFELKLMTILHDIAKKEGVVDNSHPIVSAKYVNDILNRYSLPEVMKYEVVNNILNHHWGADYNQRKNSTEKTMTKMGTMPNYEIQRIFARADLLSIGNEQFSNDKLKGLTDESQNRLITAMSRAKETTPLIYTTPIVKPELIPEISIKFEDGTEKNIKPIYLQELNDANIEQYGFLPGIKPEDVTIGVHMADSLSDFNTFKMLMSNPLALSLQSVSIISKDNNATYKRFGIVVDLRAADVINATYYNQSSGFAKTMDNIVALETGNNEYEFWRETIPNKIQEKLNISETEYAQLASQLEDFNYLTQIQDSEIITIGDKTFNGIEIKNAIANSQKELMEMATRGAKGNYRSDIYGNLTELVVKRATVVDNTYVVKFNSPDDVNNTNIPQNERLALSRFLSEIPDNATIIFAGYKGLTAYSPSNPWTTKK